MHLQEAMKTIAHILTITFEFFVNNAMEEYLHLFLKIDRFLGTHQTHSRRVPVKPAVTNRNIKPEVESSSFPQKSCTNVLIDNLKS